MCHDGERDPARPARLGEHVPQVDADGSLDPGRDDARHTRRRVISSAITPAMTAATIPAVEVRLPMSDRLSRTALACRWMTRPGGAPGEGWAPGGRTMMPPLAARPWTRILAAVLPPGGVSQPAALLCSHATPTAVTAATTSRTTANRRANFTAGRAPGHRRGG
jgi:hypothetical protein